MATAAQRPKLLAIVGPTASGKSDLAMRLAKEFNGEIICADSLTIYKNMNIGTAKPDQEEQTEVRHWALDLIGPGQRCTAAQFQGYAKWAISGISNRGKLPILVGGTGLYADAVLYDFKFAKANSQRDPLNPRHLKKGHAGLRSMELSGGVELVGLLPNDEQLKKRISQRVEKMFAQGLVSETELLVRQYGIDSLIAKAKVAYGPVIDYLSGTLSLEEAKAKLKTAHWQYARRQKTWFKRNEHIKWFSTADQAYNYVKKQLLNT